MKERISPATLHAWWTRNHSGQTVTLDFCSLFFPRIKNSVCACVHVFIQLCVCSTFRRVFVYSEGFLQNTLLNLSPRVTYRGSQDKRTLDRCPVARLIWPPPRTAAVTSADRINRTVTRLTQRWANKRTTQRNSSCKYLLSMFVCGCYQIVLWTAGLFWFSFTFSESLLSPFLSAILLTFGDKLV